MVIPVDVFRRQQPVSPGTDRGGNVLSTLKHKSMLFPFLLIESLILAQINAEESFKNRIARRKLILSDFSIAVFVKGCQCHGKRFHPDPIVRITARCPCGKIDFAVRDDRCAVDNARQSIKPPELFPVARIIGGQLS